MHMLNANSLSGALRMQTSSLTERGESWMGESDTSLHVTRDVARGSSLLSSYILALWPIRIQINKTSCIQGHVLLYSDRYVL